MMRMRTTRKIERRAGFCTVRGVEGKRRQQRAQEDSSMDEN